MINKKKIIKRLLALTDDLEFKAIVIEDRVGAAKVSRKIKYLLDKLASTI